jgi:hypothetical protein
MQSNLNSNVQLNTLRENFNSKTSKLSILGVTKTVIWNSKRRYRSI